MRGWVAESCPTLVEYAEGKGCPEATRGSQTDCRFIPEAILKYRLWRPSKGPQDRPSKGPQDRLEFNVLDFASGAGHLAPNLKPELLPLTSDRGC